MCDVLKKDINLISHKYSKLLFIACFIAYASSYIGRVNYSAALASILAEGFFTKSQAGFVGSVFFIVYGSCQLLWGILGDRLSPFKMIITGLFFAAVSNLAFSFSQSYVTMSVIWGINGMSHSMLWSPVLRILSNVINKDYRQKACLNISLAIPSGTIFAYLLSSFIIKYFVWRSVFLISFAFLITAFVFFVFTFIKIRQHLTFTDLPDINKKTLSNKESLHIKGIAAMLISSGLFVAILPTILHGTLKEGITVWVPTMISETYGTSVSFSVFLTMLLPLCYAAGAYLISPVYNKIMKKNEMATAAFTMSMAVLPLIALLFLDRLLPVISVILMAVITTAAHSYNYLLITLVPVRFARFGKTATVTGIMNSSAYLGSAASTYGLGAVAESFGWQRTIYIWLIIALIIAIICILLTKRWKCFCESLEDNVERI